MRNGNATIEVPAAADENVRDYSLRIEARVTDASNREVLGNTVAHATVGTFLIAALDRHVRRARLAARSRSRCAPSSYTGVPQAAAPMRVAVLARAHNARWDDDGGTSRGDRRPRSRPTPRAAPSWTVPVPATPGDYRVRATAAVRRPRPSSTTVTCGCRARRSGPRKTTATTGISSSSPRRRQCSPARRRAS